MTSPFVIDDKITITGNGITLDGNGFEMIGAPLLGVGVSVSSGTDNNTVKNFKITNYRFGIISQGTNHNILDNTIFGEGLGAGIGIFANSCGS